MYDLNHMGGGSSSGLFPFVSFTATCIKMTSIQQPPQILHNFHHCQINAQTTKDCYLILK